MEEGKIVSVQIGSEVREWRAFPMKKLQKTTRKE